METVGTVMITGLTSHLSPGALGEPHTFHSCTAFGTCPLPLVQGPAHSSLPPLLCL